MLVTYFSREHDLFYLRGGIGIVCSMSLEDVYFRNQYRVCQLIVMDWGCDFCLYGFAVVPHVLVYTIH